MLTLLDTGLTLISDGVGDGVYGRSRITSGC